MTVTAASFRTDLTEFSNTTSYPDSSVNYWLGIGTIMLSADRWGRLLDFGLEMFTAHNLVLEFKAQAESANGAAPGITTGPIQMKVVDKVQIQYDTQHGIEEGAGHWNTTIYGTRFIRMCNQMGAGPVQVGASCGYADPLSSAGAWYGPYTGPGFSNQ